MNAYNENIPDIEKYSNNLESLLNDIETTKSMLSFFDVNKRHKIYKLIESKRQSLRKNFVNSIIDIQAENLHDEFGEKSNFRRILGDKYIKAKIILDSFKYIFTLNYDTSTYSMFTSLITTESKKIWTYNDLFHTTEVKTSDKITFDVDNIHASDSSKYLIYLHGALHILKSKANTFKIVAKRYIPSDGSKTTMSKAIQYYAYKYDTTCVFEGSSQSKLQQIDENSYLRYCYQMLIREKIEILFILGAKLGDEDEHIVKAINDNICIKKLYIAVYDIDKNELEILRYRHIFSKFDVRNKLVIFESKNFLADF